MMMKHRDSILGRLWRMIEKEGGSVSLGYLAGLFTVKNDPDIASVGVSGLEITIYAKKARQPKSP